MRDQAGTLTDVAYCDPYGRIVAFSQPFNIGAARNGGIGLNATLRPASFMNIRLYANLFDDYYRVQYRPGKWAESEMLCYSLRLNFWAKLWDKLQLFANANYRSRTQTLLAEVDPTSALTAASVPTSSTSASPSSSTSTTSSTPSAPAARASTPTTPPPTRAPSPADTSVSASPGASVAPRWKACNSTARNPSARRDTDNKTPSATLLSTKT